MLRAAPESPTLFTFSVSILRLEAKALKSGHSGFWPDPETRTTMPHLEG
jgi:hypothetical protein